MSCQVSFFICTFFRFESRFIQKFDLVDRTVINIVGVTDKYIGCRTDVQRIVAGLIATVGRQRDGRASGLLDVSSWLTVAEILLSISISVMVATPRPILCALLDT